MSHEIENYEDRRSISTLGAVLMGVGIGVIGTVLVVAANEERFGRAVRRTKHGAAEMGKKVRGRYNDAVDDVRDHVVSAAESVEEGARSMAKKIKY